MHRSKALRASGGLICALVMVLSLAACVPAATDPMKGVGQAGGEAINGAKANAGAAVDKANQATQDSLDVQQQTTGEEPPAP